MRDDERIRLYYDFGTRDWRSEMARLNIKVKKNSGFRTVRLLKLAALLWSLVLKNLSADKKIQSRRVHRP